MRSSPATAPPYYVDAIYANITGAVFDRQSNSYTLPCDTPVNVSMVFGNYTYPMHPIDLTVPSFVADNGTVYCQGAFSYTPDGAGLGGSF